jgi:hypothetical protein
MATSAAENKWNCNSISTFKVHYLFSYTNDYTTHFVTRHKGQSVLLDVVVVPFPCVPIGAAHTRCHYLNHDAIHWSLREWYIFNANGSSKGMIDCRFHAVVFIVFTSSITIIMRRGVCFAARRLGGSFDDVTFALREEHDEMMSNNNILPTPRLSLTFIPEQYS